MLKLRLCRVFSCTLTELSSRIDAKEFLLWQAYYAREPWGDEQRTLYKLLGVMLKEDYDKYMPYMCRSSYWDILIGASQVDKMRRGVAAAFAAVAKQISAMTKKSDKK